MSHIRDSALDAIGETPLIRCDRLAAQEGFKCNLLAKCEFFNAGGSVKDRIAKRMIEKAEAEGKLTPGQSVVIEPTSGNTGIGLALACAVKGYRCIIVMPAKMSQEKSNTLRALGAEVIRTRTEALADDPDSHISIARKMVSEDPNAVMLDQYSNRANPEAHYHTTAVEIIRALTSSPKSLTDTLSSLATTVLPLTPPTEPEALPRPSSGHVDLLVAGAGTGGTISGIATRLREHHSSLLVLGVDPVGSVLAFPSSLNDLPSDNDGAYAVEGIGYDFIPDALDRSQVDVWAKCEDDRAFEMTRRLIRTEGLLCGGSSGAAMSEAVAFLKGDERGRRLAATEGANVVVVLPDSLRNYITKPWLLQD